MSPHAQPEDLRAKMARREGLMAPWARAPNRPLPTAPNDHQTARDHANHLDHRNVQTANCPELVRLRCSRRKGGEGGGRLTQNPETTANKREPCALEQQQTTEGTGLPRLAQSMRRHSCQNKQRDTRDAVPWLMCWHECLETLLPQRNMYWYMALVHNNSPQPRQGRCAIHLQVDPKRPPTTRLPT